MRKSNIHATFKSDIQSVWAVVTDNTHTEWRSDLSRVEISEDGRRFTEYTHDGHHTEFFITTKVPFNHYAFDMQSPFFTGHWIGLLSSLPDGGTEIDFTEELSIKNPVMEVLSYLFMNLKQIQQTYVDDLRKELRE